MVATEMQVVTEVQAEMEISTVAMALVGIEAVRKPEEMAANSVALKVRYPST